jgi:hypothetical protein
MDAGAFSKQVESPAGSDNAKNQKTGAIQPMQADRNQLPGQMVRAVGIEPTLLAEPDFESGASTNSTTPAHGCPRQMANSTASVQPKIGALPNRAAFRLRNGGRADSLYA